MKSRKELKNDYRQHQSTMGVFQVENKINGLLWIDGSTDVTASWNRAQTELRFGSHRNKQLQEDWNKFSPEDFEFKILSELAYKEDASVNYKKEVKLLLEMVLEDLAIDKGQQY